MRASLVRPSLGWSPNCSPKAANASPLALPREAAASFASSAKRSRRRVTRNRNCTPVVLPPRRTRLPLPAWICSLPVVSKRTSPVPTKLFRWRVIRLRGSPAMWLGDVDAPDEPSAIEEAIKIYNITDREHQRHLAVRRIK
jgi:hypothetical protein